NGLHETAVGVWRMLNVVIIGAGKGGSSLLNALLKMSRHVRVLGVADRRPDAPGLALAAARGIPTTSDYTGLVCLPEVDIIVDATGQPGLDEEIRRLKWPRAVVIEGLAMNLILSFVEESHRLLRALEEKELERDVMLDSTHDAIVAVN